MHGSSFQTRSCVRQTVPVQLIMGIITSRCRGFRLFAAGTMLTLSWTGGLLVHLLLTVALHVMLRTVTG
ncbi:hypothetical protein GCM10008956_40420 [Deinococcus arenae]|uniref:Uncharacterized protein n=1 Tax=Deinococcus arenae TaxID=1452751 RepID=A0A8H9LAR9_9DEIO|nr:hypothetical protein GCM10008956_40420 [Deinococcus arenae]